MRVAVAVLAVLTVASLPLLAGVAVPSVRASAPANPYPSLLPPVADPGGPYASAEGSPFVLDGSGSRGSPAVVLLFRSLEEVNTLDPNVVDEHVSAARGGDGILHVAWKRDTSPSPQGYAQAHDQVLYARRTSSGTFAPTTVVAQSEFAIGDDFGAPALAIAGDIVYLAWFECCFQPKQGGPLHLTMFLRRSLDGGASFEPARTIVAAPAGLRSPALAVGPSGVLYASWHQQRTDPAFWGGGDVYVSRSDDGGLSFLPAVRVNDVPDSASQAGVPGHVLRVDASGAVIIVWTDLRFSADPRLPEAAILVARSEDGGATFSAPVRVSGTASFRPGGPRAVFDWGGTLHIVWGDRRGCPNPTIGWRVWHAASPDGGKTVSPDHLVSDDPAWTCAVGSVVSLASDADALYLAWGDTREGPPRMRVTASRDGGATFGPGVWVEPTHACVRKTDYCQHTPTIVALDDRVAVLLEETSSRVAGKPYNVMYAEAPLTQPLVSHTWDLDAAVDADGDGDATNDADASGPTPSVVYGDDGTYEVTLRVEDTTGATASATTTVTVANLPPTIDSLAYGIDTVLADAWVRLAGERWHDARATLYEDGVPIGATSITRVPGGPDAQEALLGTIEPAAHAYDVSVAYTPEDDPVNGQEEGATPAWLVFRWEGGEHRLPHLFNVRHPETWTWLATDVGAPLPAWRVTFDAAATDPGSDDLAFAWDFGDGASATRTHYNDGAAPDPPRSPGGAFPFSASDRAAHAYAKGSFTVTLTVTDDDGGVASHAVSLALPPWAASSETPRVRLHAPLLAGPPAFPILPPPDVEVPAASPPRIVPASVWVPGPDQGMADFRAAVGVRTNR